MLWTEFLRLIKSVPVLRKPQKTNKKNVESEAALKPPGVNLPSHRGGFSSQGGSVWARSALLFLCLSALSLLQVAFHSSDGLDGEHCAGTVQDGGDETEQSYGCVGPAHVAAHPGVAVARVQPLPLLTHVCGVDPHDEMEVESHGHHVRRRTNPLKYQRSKQELLGHQVGRFVPGHHKEQRDDAKGQAKGDTAIDARRPHLAVLHVQVSHLLQLSALQVKVGVDVKAAQPAHRGHAR